MTFQEKSAWGLLAGIVLVSAYYFPAAFQIVEVNADPRVLGAISAVGVVAIIVIEAIYHIVIAAGGNTEMDERDTLIDLKAERNSSLVLGIGLFSLVGYVVINQIRTAGESPMPMAIVVCIILALTVSELAKLVSQIWYYRADAM